MRSAPRRSSSSTIWARTAAGLIALTGGIEGPVGRALSSGNRGLAEGLLERLAVIFPDRLYVELVRHGLEVEDQLEPALIDLALELDLPLVATNDVHFLDAAEWESHDVLLCIAEGAQVGQAERRRVTPEHRFKSAQEMAELFADVPEALANTLVIAQRCAFKVPSQAPILPAFPTEEGLERGERAPGQGHGRAGGTPRAPKWTAPARASPSRPRPCAPIANGSSTSSA